MKQYTIIYSVPVGRANTRASVVKSDRVETTNLRDLLSQDKYYGYVHFVFEGWPILEGEFDIKPKKP